MYRPLLLCALGASAAEIPPACDRAAIISHAATPAALPEIRQMLFEGRNGDAVKLAQKTMMGQPSGIKPYQSLGELWIESPALTSVTDYQRWLDLDRTITGVRYVHDGVRHVREVFSSAPPT